MALAVQQTARSVWRDRLGVTTKTGLTLSGRCKWSSVRTYFTTHPRTLETTLNLCQRYSSTRASTCSLQIYCRSPEEWLYLLLLDLSQKAFVNDQTCPQYLMQGNNSSSGRAQKAISRRSKSKKTDGQEGISFRP